MDFPTLDRGLTTPLSGVIFGLADIFGQICQKKSFHLSPAVTTAIMQIRSNFGQRGRLCWKLFLILPLFTRPLTVLYWIIAFFGFSNEWNFVLNLQWSKPLPVFISTAVDCFWYDNPLIWSVLHVGWAPNLRSFELSKFCLQSSFM